MIDLETWSTRSNAAILSIGAVKFNADNYEVVDKFYCNVDPQSCKAIALHFCPDTIEWWKGNPDAFAQTKTARIPIEQAITDFLEWCGDCSKTEIWANGAAFDLPIIEWPIRYFDKKIPWQFWNVRDARTVYKLAKLDTKTFAAREGTFHNAVDDCITQVKMLKSIFGEN